MEFFVRLWKYLPDFWYGMQLTVELTVVSAVVGFICALPLVGGAVYGNWFFKAVCKSYITLIRGTPMLVQLFFIYYGMPALGFKLSPLTAAMIGFVLNSAAYQAEYLKGGFLAISNEQVEAGLSIGLTRFEVIRHIVFPQAFRFSVPALFNEIIYLVKYTSMAYIVQVPELFAQAKFFASDTYMYLQTFIFIGIVYLIMILFVSKLSDWLERRLYIPGFEVAHLK